MDTFVGVRAFKTGVWTLALYTIVLATLAVARGSEKTPGYGSAWKRFYILAILIFALACVSNAIEIVLYLPAVAVAGSIAGGIIQTVILAVVLVRVTQPGPNHEAPRSLGFSHGRGVAAILFLAVAWIPVYFLFVTLDTPVVHWLEHGNADVFAHPPAMTMVGLELVRGFLHAGILIGIASLARESWRRTWFWGSCAIAVLNGWLPILPVSTLPLGIRIANGVEITLSSVMFAGIAAGLFALLAFRRHAVVHPVTT